MNKSEYFRNKQFYNSSCTLVFKTPSIFKSSLGKSFCIITNPHSRDTITEWCVRMSDEMYDWG